MKFWLKKMFTTWPHPSSSQHFWKAPSEVQRILQNYMPCTYCVREASSRKVLCKKWFHPISFISFYSRESLQHLRWHRALPEEDGEIYFHVHLFTGVLSQSFIFIKEIKYATSTILRKIILECYIDNKVASWIKNNLFYTEWQLLEM